MAEILFEKLTPPIKYFPFKLGKAEVILDKRKSADYVNESITLKYDGLQWCVLNCNTQFELKEQYIEINLAYGKVVTTGLGFGLVQSFLCQKPDVDKVIVYEQNTDIIDLFRLFAEKSNFDISKIEIINADADEIKDIECDWLVMDHFECVHQPEWEVIDKVRKIANNNNAKNVMFWPMVSIYKQFCDMKRLGYNSDSFKFFASKLAIKNFPSNLDDLILKKIEQFRYGKNPKVIL